MTKEQFDALKPWTDQPVKERELFLQAVSFPLIIATVLQHCLTCRQGWELAIQHYLKWKFMSYLRCAILQVHVQTEVGVCSSLFFS